MYLNTFGCPFYTYKPLPVIFPFCILQFLLLKLSHSLPVSHPPFRQQFSQLIHTIHTFIPTPSVDSPVHNSVYIIPHPLPPNFLYFSTNSLNMRLPIIFISKIYPQLIHIIHILIPPLTHQQIPLNPLFSTNFPQKTIFAFSKNHAIIIP